MTNNPEKRSLIPQDNSAEILDIMEEAVGQNLSLEEASKKLKEKGITAEEIASYAEFVAPEMSQSTAHLLYCDRLIDYLEEHPSKSE